MAGNADKINCVAEPANRYYGTRGALRCLNEVGDVAILESQYLNGMLRVRCVCFFLRI